ncbi:MAG: Dabb family protein [Bacteroidales bacterium]|nr:Dabb family protein [Bacteroidales bacterium]
MKNKACFLALTIFSIFLFSCQNEKKPDKVLRHVVMFGFKPEVTPEQVKEIEDAFGKLPDQIKEIKDYEWGVDCSPEGLQKGLSHCFFVTFFSDADRDTYLTHPAHKAFGKIINGKVEAVTVVDYWTK